MQQFYAYLRTHEYTGPADVIPTITEEWLRATSDGTPVIGWPYLDYLEIYFDGHINDGDQKTIKTLVQYHFDGKDKPCLFPIESVEIKIGEDQRSGKEITAVRITGNRDRAQEMLHPRQL